MKRLLSVLLIGAVGWGPLEQVKGACGFRQLDEQTLRVYSDFVSLQEGEEVEVYVLSNDIGVSGGVAKLEITKQAKFVNAEVVDNSYIRMTAIPGFSGSDELTYRICLDNGECGEAQVMIKVSDFDFVPVATVDTFILKPGETVEVDILENDRNLFDIPISVEIIYDAVHSLSEINDGLLTLTVDAFFRGKDSLQYRVCDKEGDCDWTWVMLKTEDEEKKNIFIPQAMSPNGDGLNDKFIIPDFQGETMKIKIFDITGQLVYSNDDYHNDWDGYANIGKFEGGIVDNGTYYYLLNVASYHKAFSGYIYLIR
ncbi:T9SS C-terminal target domain-containing protein [Saccharicrinis fermentans]|uniref:Gliding motility-associated C-terminal domain protein n=1 Tax=Saccharicrinis fermentans DSM 9555 = JCM 21142 TaxID=869213 RepID=W7YN59_9BACT|nr:T9SS C-terminal target domain-containing protein [Saccharicrinis fermentans]GAF03854.1 hypothetical protein JCM21142_72541 [Saccharicrinis fermentans DSM 9555 = JCM 21142]